MQFSFKTENAQFLSDPWTAPTVRILSQESTLDSLPDIFVGGSWLELVGSKGKVPNVIP